MCCVHCCNHKELRGKQHFEHELCLGCLSGRRYKTCNCFLLPISVAARSKAWVYGRLLAGIVGSNPTGGLSVLSVVCCQVEVSATGW